MVMMDQVSDRAVRGGVGVFYLNRAVKLAIILRSFRTMADPSMKRTLAGRMAFRRAVGRWANLAAGLPAGLLHSRSAEWPGRCRLAAAIGLGVFIGCVPLFGANFWLCAGLASAFRLSRLKLYLAANISTPLLAPVIAFAEIQLGSYVQDGVVHTPSLVALTQTSPWHFTGDLLVGAFVVGSALSGFAATATWTFARSWFDPREENVITGAAARYLRVGTQAWELANAKLRFDPVYRESIRSIEWPSEGRVLDLGCGRGLMLSVLAAHLRRSRDEAPLLLHGIDYRARMVRLARRALGDRATVERADLAVCELPQCRVAVLFDVLHCLPESAQETLLARLRESVEPGGWLLLREADAAGGARFAAVKACNRVVALLQGRWERQFHFRTAQGWLDLLARFGFAADANPNDEATPFANVLIRARRVA
jgi:trans-aconitate methyltransferase/uncharacterized protein (DUF2062 family)